MAAANLRRQSGGASRDAFARLQLQTSDLWPQSGSAAAAADLRKRRPGRKEYCRLISPLLFSYEFA
jgi:hypothetical protein